jgi:hypothetical protein
MVFTNYKSEDIVQSNNEYILFVSSDDIQKYNNRINTNYSHTTRIIINNKLHKLYRQDKDILFYLDSMGFKIYIRQIAELC